MNQELTALCTELIKTFSDIKYWFNHYNKNPGFNGGTPIMVCGRMVSFGDYHKADTYRRLQEAVHRAASAYSAFQKDVQQVLENAGFSNQDITNLFHEFERWKKY